MNKELRRKVNMTHRVRLIIFVLLMVFVGVAAAAVVSYEPEERYTITCGEVVFENAAYRVEHGSFIVEDENGKDVVFFERFCEVEYPNP